jgi:hypothetical protein
MTSIDPHPDFEYAMHLYAKRVQEITHGRPAEFLELLEKRGSVECAKELLNSAQPQSEFVALTNARALDLSMEAIILSSARYRSYFSDAELRTAYERLVSCGFEPDWHP